MTEVNVDEKVIKPVQDRIRPRDILWTALDVRVLAVAKEGYVGDWAAYIGAVVGNNREEDVKEVMSNGSKLPQKVAEVLFPTFAERFIWRE